MTNLVSKAARGKVGRRMLPALAIVGATVALGAQGLPSTPRGLRIVTDSSDRPPAPRPVDTTPLPPSQLPVRPGHPRLHFTPQTLPTWRSWLAGPLRAPWQQFVRRMVDEYHKSQQEAVNADLYALVWLGGSVPGIDYGGVPLEAFAERAVSVMRERVGLGFENHGVNLSAVNHPFHSGGHVMESFARAHDWLYNFNGYTATDKRATAEYLLGFCSLLFEFAHSNTGKPVMNWSGDADAFDGAPGSEEHHPWYYVLPLIGDGLIDDTRARQYMAAMETHFLQGGWLDVAHFESRGAGTKALGGYGSWFPKRLILNFHGWKTATGQDYFNSPTPLSPEPGYFRNFPITYFALQKPQDPGRVLPLGQARGDASFPSDINRMLTGVLTGQEARWAAHLGGPMMIRAEGDGLEFLTYDPTVTPEAPPVGVTNYRTYGLIVDKRADGTIITMGAPPIKLRGHTWATQGGGPLSGVPLGVTLQVAGVPVLVKHVGDHRGNVKAFGQNTVRFYDPAVPTSDLNAWRFGGLLGRTIAGLRVQDITPADDLGGIKGWTAGNPNRAVADMTQWYDPSRVRSFIRTYEWGPNFLRVIDDIQTTRPDILVWSRWYTGHTPTINGVGVPTGFSERPAPSGLRLGPVQWTLAEKPASTLHVAGGPGYEWVDDLGNIEPEKRDTDIFASEGALEIGAYTITFKSVGSGRWVHMFTW